MGTRRYTINAPSPLQQVYNWFINDLNSYSCALHDKTGSVTNQEDGSLLWQLNIQNKPIKYVARITESEPNVKIAWKSTDGSPNGGELKFQEVASDETIIAVIIEYDGPDSEDSPIKWDRFPPPR
jgi:uncharacterized membrane protein